VRPVAGEGEISKCCSRKKEENPTAKPSPFGPSGEELLSGNRFAVRASISIPQSVRSRIFPYARVKQGILDHRGDPCFHVTFRQEQGVPGLGFVGWRPGQVLDAGKVIGRFYLDMHPAPRANSPMREMGAACSDGIRGKQLPEATLICNFPAARPPEDPGLMEYGDVQTFFHEFGHLMHAILGGQQPWAGISGVSMESGFRSRHLSQNAGRNG